jgi:hypothetical protein
MASIDFNFNTPPPTEYDEAYYDWLVSALNDALSRIDYATESDSVAQMGLHWIGL